MVVLKKMKMIVALGNPGEEYRNTRHNTGFYFLDAYLKEKGFSDWKKKPRAKYLEKFVNNEKIIFLEPLSFMNLSGEVVADFQKYYDIPTENILVICDDLDLSLGKIKIKAKGSCGGHNGMRNIELHLKTQNYKRIKIGISNDKEKSTIDYVLGKFSKKELQQLEQLIPKVNQILDAFFVTDFSVLMSKYSEKNR